MIINHLTYKDHKLQNRYIFGSKSSKKSITWYSVKLSVIDLQFTSSSTCFYVLVYVNNRSLVLKSKTRFDCATIFFQLST